MRSRPVFLLCGVLLLTAFSVRADSVFYSGATNESPNTEISATEARGFAAKFRTPAIVSVMPEPFLAVAPVWGREIHFLALDADSPNTAISAKTFHTSVLVADALQNGERLSDPSPAITFIGGFEPDGAFAARGSGPSFVVGTFFPPSSEASLHSSPSRELGSGDLTSSASDSEDARLRAGREHHKGGGDGKSKGLSGAASVGVPEPGAFSLLLFGLAAVGILARRRSISTTTA
jgi:hypothetical protein